MSKPLRNAILEKKGNKNYYEFKGSPFINPYNFVSLSQNKKSVGKDEKECITGVMDCAIKVKTPLIILNTETVMIKNDEHKTYDFFEINGVPTNPASSIRGPLRTVYETITDSCMSVLNDSITARTKNAFQAGLLVKKDGKYELYKAQRYIFKVNGRNYKEYTDKNGEVIAEVTQQELTKYRYGDIIKFSTKNKSYEKSTKSGKKISVGKYITEIGTGTKEGFIVIGESFSRKHFESVFEKGELVEKNEAVLKKAYEKYKTVLEVYKDSAVNKKNTDSRKWYEHIDGTIKHYDMLDAGVLPVWYKQEGRSLYFSPANVGKYAYYADLENMVGDKSPCHSRNTVCKACNLFGMMADDGVGASRGSKIRVTDAIASASDKPQYLQLTLKELASPHPSYLPFYGKVKTNDIKGYDELAGGIGGHKVAIRGRKFYWHFTPDLKSGKQGNRNITVKAFQPTKNNVDFKFKIYFDGISEEQLSELVTAVCLNENTSESSMMHKLGHGKPLGFGSVKFIIEKIQIRKYEADEYKVEECTKKYVGNPKVEIPQDLKLMLTFNEKWNYETVHYPKVEPYEGYAKENEVAAHQWFTNNFSLGSNKATAVLPYPVDDVDFSITEKSKDEKQEKKEEKKESSPKVELKSGDIYVATVKEYPNAKSIKFTVQGCYPKLSIEDLNQSSLFKSEELTKKTYRERLPLESKWKVKYTKNGEKENFDIIEEEKE